MTHFDKVSVFTTTSSRVAYTWFSSLSCSLCSCMYTEKYVIFNIKVSAHTESICACIVAQTLKLSYLCRDIDCILVVVL